MAAVEIAIGDKSVRFHESRYAEKGARPRVSCPTTHLFNASNRKCVYLTGLDLSGLSCLVAKARSTAHNDTSCARCFSYITLHYITLHYITLHYITLHCITLKLLV